MPKFSGPSQPSGSGNGVGSGSDSSSGRGVEVKVGGGVSVDSVVASSWFSTTVVAVGEGSLVVGASSRTAAFVGSSSLISKVGAGDTAPDSPVLAQAHNKIVKMPTGNKSQIIPFLTILLLQTGNIGTSAAGPAHRSYLKSCNTAKYSGTRLSNSLMVKAGNAALTRDIGIY